jgi:DivIVA domain-containing protein
VTLVQIIALLAVAFGIALVAAGRGQGLAVADPDRPPLDLPAEIRADEIDAISFSLGVRGYRMDEVDLAMERIRETLAMREREIAQLRGDVQVDESD